MAFSVRRGFVLVLLISIVSFVGERFYQKRGSVAVAGVKEKATSTDGDAGQSSVDAVEDPASRIIKALQRGSQVRNNDNQVPGLAGERRYVSKYLGAEELAEQMQETVRVLKGQKSIEHEKLKLRILENKRTWMNNMLMAKLQKASVMEQSEANASCTIRVLEYCGHFCYNVRGEPIIGWKNYPCGFTVCQILFTVSIEMEDFLISDVVVFMPGVHDWHLLVEKRPPGQLWIYHSKESPVHWAKFTPPPELGNPFDLSLTYMTDSDIAHPYFFYQPDSVDDNLLNITVKTRLISWMSSNCNKTSWNRVGFIHRLQKHLPIDTYGLCGSLVCARYDPVCKDLSSHFKFNLAFENSQCPEYISEKFWWNGLSQGTVPVVFGAPKEDYERLAPPKSFIHLDDFSSIEEFANYLKELDRNETLYKEYFKWREYGTVLRGSSLLSTRRLRPSHVCYLLTVLIDKSYNPEKYPWQRNHPVFHEWWTGMCSESQTVLGEDIFFLSAEVGVD